jgi:hypothetical protein
MSSSCYESLYVQSDLQTLIFNQLFYSLLLQPCNVEINHRFAALPFNLKLALDNLIPH